MSNLVTSASRRSAALNPARKPATDWRSRLLACPTRYKVAVLVCLLLSAFGWLGFTSHQQSVEPVKLFAYKLTPRQLQECSQFISKLGVDHRPSPDGDNLLVPPEKRLTLLNQIGAEQLPNEDPAGKVNQMGLTPSRREALSREQAELQLSLARTLKTMQGVDNATVQLAIPESSAFEENNHPTAAVMLTLQSGYEMSQRQSIGIARFVAGAIPAMRQQDVTVVDQTGREQLHDSEGQLDSLQFELQKQLEVYMQGKAQRMLDMAYGRGNALAIVNVQPGVFPLCAWEAGRGLRPLNEAAVNYSPCGLSQRALATAKKSKETHSSTRKDRACLVRFLADLFNPGQGTKSEIQPNPMQTPYL